MGIYEKYFGRFGSKMKYKIPDDFMGISIKGAMERALSNPNTKPIIQQPSSNNLTLNDFIILKNPILGYNWFDTHKELYNQGLRMLTIPEFLELLKQSNQQDKSLYEQITKPRSPARYEWLDADFKFKNNQLYINSNHIIDANGNLMPRSSEILEPCLMQDKLPGIDLEYWINNHTKQGLPLENTPAGSLYYWLPRSENNSVAGFDAYSDWADLVCSRNPTNSNASLGVRFVRSASR